jgi:hypothetical protein
VHAAADGKKAAHGIDRFLFQQGRVNKGGEHGRKQDGAVRCGRPSANR